MSRSIHSASASSHTLWLDDTRYDERQFAIRGGVRRDFRQVVFRAIAEHLRSRGVGVRLERRKTFLVQPEGAARRRARLADSLAVLQCRRTEAYGVLDLHDWPDLQESIEPCLLDRRCRLVLKSQYRPGAIQGERAGIVKPWTYFDFNWPHAHVRLTRLRSRPRPLRRLYFRGDAWCGRGAVLERLRQRRVTNPDQRRVSYEQYLREASRHRIMLSLPGLGDFCHRDIEGFAMGTCVLRPRIRTRFHDELRADHHYISVEADLEQDPPQLIAERIESRLADALERPDFLDAVARQAADWYDRNVALRNSMELTAALLGLPADA